MNMPSSTKKLSCLADWQWILSPIAADHLALFSDVIKPPAVRSSWKSATLSVFHTAVFSRKVSPQVREKVSSSPLLTQCIAHNIRRRNRGLFHWFWPAFQPRLEWSQECVYMVEMNDWGLFHKNGLILKSPFYGTALPMAAFKEKDAVTG